MMKDHPEALPQLVRYQCDCIGFPPVGGWALIVKVCDNDYDAPPMGLMMRRPRRSDDHEILDEIENFNIWSRLDDCIDKGNAYDDVRLVLKRLVQ